jgi:TRAP-type uncharacterized transport system substrate-binding protein
LIEGQEPLVWANFDPKTSMLAEKTGIPLHPGAERYFREAGLM